MAWRSIPVQTEDVLPAGGNFLNGRAGGLRPIKRQMGNYMVIGWGE